MAGGSIVLLDKGDFSATIATVTAAMKQLQADGAAAKARLLFELRDHLRAHPRRVP